MKYLLDTKALIAFFNNEDGAENVEAILKEIDDDRADGFISAITLTELYYLYTQRIGEQVAKERIEQLRYSKLKIISINEAIALKAGEYKLKAIPIADAFIAASAEFIAAPVVTDDPHFGQVNVPVLKFRELDKNEESS